MPVVQKGQAELVAADYAFDDSVWIEPWPGTHLVTSVRYQGASVVLSGDIMHTAPHCAEPQLNSCFAEEATATSSGDQFDCRSSDRASGSKVSSGGPNSLSLKPIAARNASRTSGGWPT